MRYRMTDRHGFTLVEMVIVIVIVGILAAVAVPKFLYLRQEAEQASVESIVGSLESALSIYASKQYLDGNSLAVHNPFDDLANQPENYLGALDPVTPRNTPAGHWTFRPSRNWVVYRPKASITGGWERGGEKFMVFQVEPVVDGADTVGLRLATPSRFAFEWE